MHINQIFQWYRRFRPFTEQEAWALFRMAAIGEAIGWTLLITGILVRDVFTAGNPIMEQLGGRIHGMLFLFYILAVLLCSPSLSWSLPRTVIAGLFSIPPYGSMAYELWSAGERNRSHLQVMRATAQYRSWTAALEP